jgi:hypothetical protein
MIGDHDYDKIRKSDDQAKGDTDRCFPSLGGDRQRDPDKHKCENSQGVGESLADLGLVRGVIRSALVLLQRVPQFAQSEFVRMLILMDFAEQFF